jgi:CheY-like chemotaxis protein
MSGSIILHVEDDADEAFIVRRALEKAEIGCAIHQVVDGEGAIDYLSGASPFDQRDRHPLPDVILLDLKLPGKDGFDVLMWARSQGSLQATPIIVLTSSDRPEDLQRANALGATAYLNKSVSCRNVIELLKTLDPERPGKSPDFQGP